MTVRVEAVGAGGAVLLLTLDRPSKRNAVDHPTLLELLAIQARCTARTGFDEPRTSGGDHRCGSGVQCGCRPDRCRARTVHGRSLGAVLRGFGASPIPVVAAIDGPALGAGAQLAVAADLRIATADSVIGVPAAKLGLVVDHWTVRRFADEFSPPVARAMLIGAETYTADRLHAIGGIHRLGDLDDALDWADQLAALAPLDDRRAQAGARAPHATSRRSVEMVEAARAVAWASDDAVEGRTAFLGEAARPLHRHVTIRSGVLVGDRYPDAGRVESVRVGAQEPRRGLPAVRCTRRPRSAIGRRRRHS